jgi:hypothetical protein
MQCPATRSKHLPGRSRSASALVHAARPGLPGGIYDYQTEFAAVHPTSWGVSGLDVGAFYTWVQNNYANWDYGSNCTPDPSGYIIGWARPDPRRRPTRGDGS